MIEHGTWRSQRGDTWPHRRLDVELDFWPQSTHLVGTSPDVFVCATGGGGGSQQATFRGELDPLLARAHESWRSRSPAHETAATGLERLFGEIQHGFEALTEPRWADQFEASAVALLVTPGACAIANVGVERAWLFRAGRLDRLSKDYTLGDHLAPEPEALVTLPASLLALPGSAFGRARPGPVRWHVQEIAPEPGDIFVLISGFRDTGLDEDHLGAALSEAPRPSPREIAQRLGEHAADVSRRLGGLGDQEIKRASWRVHSRLALAVVRIS